MTLRFRPDLVSGIVFVDSFIELRETFMSLTKRRAVAEQRADDVAFSAMVEGSWPGRTPKSGEERCEGGDVGDATACTD